MSYSVDVGILLHATDESSVLHERARAFLKSRLDDRDLFCLLWPVVHTYVRLASHPRIFTRPLSARDAMANIRQLMALPRVRVLGEGPEHWRMLEEISSSVPARGNGVADAVVAALLREHGISTFYTSDPDFRRFSFLNVVDPFVGVERAQGAAVDDPAPASTRGTQTAPTSTLKTRSPTPQSPARDHHLTTIDD